MTRIDVGILEDDEEADVAAFMLEACGIESTEFLFNERILSRENFEKNSKTLLRMAKNRGSRRAPYFVIGYFALLTGAEISEKLRQKILEVAKWEHEEGYWHDNDFALKRKIYLEDFSEKIRIHKAGIKLHPAIFKYSGKDFVESRVLMGISQFRDIYENGNILDIEHLNLDGWNLMSIPQEIVELQNLKSLSLEFNQISEIREEISNLASLKHLFLNYNQIKVIPDSIGNLSSLESLSITHNGIASLPTSIKKLKNLTHIYVRGTKIHQAPKFLKASEFDDLNETIYLK
jgi:hypothetical protein